MKKVNYIWILIILFSVSCVSITPTKYSCSGSVTKEERITGSFNRLNISTLFDANLIQSNEEKVVVEIDKNLQEIIVVENKDSTLYLKLIGNISIPKVSSVKINIYYKSINYLKISGFGNIVCLDTIKSNDFLLEVDGNTNLSIKADKITVYKKSFSKVQLDGSCDSLNIFNEGTGDLNTRNLFCNVLKIDNKAYGKAEVFAQKEMFINKSVWGDLDLYGSGEIKQIISEGSGKLIKH